MILIFIFFFLLHFSLGHDLLDTQAEFIFSAQNWCTSQIPITSASKALMDSFLCGVNIRDLFLHELFLQTGLIHLLVVSGGHFAFLIASFDFFFSGQKTNPFFGFLKILLLLSFSILTGFQPPVVRALSALSIRFLNSHFQWGWDQGKIQLCAGLLVLILFPSWIISLSFYLSWLASIGLCFTPLWTKTSFKKKQSLLQQFLMWLCVCLLIQCFLSLFFWQFSWISFFMNLLVAPLLMWALWPLGLLLVLIPSLHPWIDICWRAILQVLEICLHVLQESGMQKMTPTEINFSNLQWGYLWSLPILFHVFLELMTRLRFRKQYV